MYRSILVPLDGSQHAEHAVPWALTLAQSGTQLILTHIHVPPTPIVMEGVVVTDPSTDTVIRQHEGEYLSNTVKAVKDIHSEMTVTGLTLDSDTALPVSLANASTETSTELIVMTTHGRGPFSRFLLGSIADDTFRASPVPVLIVRGADQASNLRGRPGISEVLIALDGSTNSEAIIAPATKLAKQVGASITLLMVADSASTEALTGSESTEQYLERLVKEIGEQGVTARFRLLPSGDPATLILSHGNANPGIVTALTTHGRTGLSRLFAGSVASSVVHGAAGPVLVFRPHPTAKG